MYTAATLPQLVSSKPYISDSGLETALVFLKDRPLREFASFELVAKEDDTDAVKRDRQLLRDYFIEHADIARKHGAGLIIETVTWRASSAWGAKLGYSQADLDEVNKRAVKFFAELRTEYIKQHNLSVKDLVISGNLGPKGDGYRVDNTTTPEEYKDYHQVQIRVLIDAGADLISAFTINHVEEGLGIARAAKAEKAPLVLSFTVETDGNLPSGMSLADAIRLVDEDTEAYPAYYMINCAHPTHFENLFKDSNKPKELNRIRGVRANASKMSHAELDQSESLDYGNPEMLGCELKNLLKVHPNIRVLGGCCGTDARHIASIADNVFSHVH